MRNDAQAVVHFSVYPADNVWLPVSRQYIWKVDFHLNVCNGGNTVTPYHSRGGGHSVVGNHLSKDQCRLIEIIEGEGVAADRTEVANKVADRVRTVLP